MIPIGNRREFLGAVTVAAASGRLGLAGFSDVRASDVAPTLGPVMLIGGRHQDLPRTIRAKFVELAGGRNARIVVIPTAVAHADEPGAFKEFAKPWVDLNPALVSVVHTRDRNKANNAEFARRIADATAVFFTNGHRDRIFNAYRGTLVETELNKLRVRGGLVGGTGVGASVLAELTLNRAGGRPWTEPGLGLLDGFLIEDQGNGKVFVPAVDSNPTVVGLELSPATAAVIEGDSLEAFGLGTITIRLARGGGQQASVRELRSPQKVSVRELQREAALRAAKQPD